jgi:hypothetical protein
VIRKTAIAWTAGLLEGEGSFGMSGRSIAIGINMTDRDVIDRIAGVLGGHIFGPVNPRRPNHHLPVWRAQLKGPNAAGWMMTIYEFLGTRRQGQVQRALSAWRSMRYVRTSPATRSAIVDAWDAGRRSKSDLGRSFGVSRDTVYRILEEGGRIGEVRERLREVDIDIAWLAGLFEGEGTVSINGRSLTVRIGMTDNDVIGRAAELMRAKIYVRRRDRTHYKPVWTAQTKGAVAAGVIMTLYPWLGIRRREQARVALAAWRRQGHGIVAGPIADAIVEYRKAGYSQADIMGLFRVGKSTVYRHTKDHVRRMHVTMRRPILPMTTPPTP